MADIALGAKALYDVFARVDADVPSVGSQSLENGLPGCFATADIEDRAKLSSDEKFGHADRHSNFSNETFACRDAVGRIAIPTVEVGLVVDLHGAPLLRNRI